ncbi:MAG: hypothetical protein ACREUU_05825 [Gammaproteobacteria bacterium]
MIVVSDTSPLTSLKDVLGALEDKADFRLAPGLKSLGLRAAGESE